MARTFAQIAAEWRRDPFPFPMPDGTEIPVMQPGIFQERAAIEAANASGNALDGLLTYVSADDGAKIAEAWGEMPAAALHAALADMREHFSTKNA